MNDVTRILSAIEQGDPKAADQLLPLVYDELRRLAARRLAQEKPGQTLQATALVHEANLRLVGSDEGRGWDSRGDFFAAAAEAMRRILVERARHKARIQLGGGLRRVDLLDGDAVNPRAAVVFKHRFFAGLTGDQAAVALGVSPRAADSLWAYARAWLFERMHPDGR
jgi:DNA-directed RNA polymerase specialized sigma24 family protein